MAKKIKIFLERKRGRFILYTNLTHHYFSESVLLHHAIYHTSGKKVSITLVFFRAQLLAFFYKNSILIWGRRFFLSKYAIMLCREEEKWRRKQKWCKQGRKGFEIRIVHWTVKGRGSKFLRSNWGWTGVKPWWCHN